MRKALSTTYAATNKGKSSDDISSTESGGKSATIAERDAIAKAKFLKKQDRLHRFETLPHVQFLLALRLARERELPVIQIDYFALDRNCALMLSEIEEQLHEVFPGVHATFLDDCKTQWEFLVALMLNATTNGGIDLLKLAGGIMDRIIRETEAEGRSDVDSEDVLPRFSAAMKLLEESTSKGTAA